jgi:hypothetical protein
MHIKPELLTWLTDEDDPSLHFRMLTELMNYPLDNKEVISTRAMIENSVQVQNIFNSMHPDGYWLQENPRSKKLVGDDVEYGSFATTHFCLSYLSELGLNKDNPKVAKAAERYLALQKSDGDWWNHYSCLFAYNIRTFIKLGYRDDCRLQKSVELLLNTSRPDGGYLCPMHENKSQSRASCIRGANKALMAFAEMPEYWQHPRCLQLVSYFLKRDAIFNNEHRKLVNRDMELVSFPIVWRNNAWEILWALSKMGYGKHPALANAWKYLGTQKNTSGQYLLVWTPSQSPWKVGKRGQPNKWITFYVLLAEKFRKEN